VAGLSGTWRLVATCCVAAAVSLAVTPPAQAVRAPAGVSTRCRVTSTEVRNPLHVQHGGVVKPYVELSATNSRGIWGGVAFDGDDVFAVIRRVHGSLQVLRRVPERGTYEPNSYEQNASVNVVGVSRRGRLVASIQPGRNLGVYRPYRSTRRGMQEMRMLPAWRSAQPTSVAPDGTSVGVARGGGHNFVVKWGPAGARVHVLAQVPGKVYSAYIATDGEVGYSYLRGGRIHAIVRRPGASSVRLVGAAGQNVDPLLSAVAGTTFYGNQEKADTNRIATWQPAAATGTTVPAHAVGRGLNDLGAVGSQHSYAGWLNNADGPAAEIFSPDGGPRQRLPRQPMPAGGQGTLPTTISRGRTIAYTAHDNLVHFLAC
jgi:hypothetical protein